MKSTLGTGLAEPVVIPQSFQYQRPLAWLGTPGTDPRCTDAQRTAKRDNGRSDRGTTLLHTEAPPLNHDTCKKLMAVN